MRKSRFYDRARNPRGFWGRRVLKRMNSDRYAAMPEWVLDNLDLPADARVLDVGCGGGANIKRILQRCSNGTVTGVDRSPLALKIADELNDPDLGTRCVLLERRAEELMVGKGVFDVVTAFEIVYYWPDVEKCLKQIFRVLTPGGRVVIANECDGACPEHKALERKVPGLHIYTADELEHQLEMSGFEKIESRSDSDRHFLCVTARKP